VEWATAQHRLVVTRQAFDLYQNANNVDNICFIVGGGDVAWLPA